MHLNPIDFCDKGDLREYLNTPFNALGHTIASNGHIMLASPLDLTYRPIKIHQKENRAFFEGLKKHLTEIETAHYTPAPTFTYPGKAYCPHCGNTGKAIINTCPECNGLGVVDLENDHNTYSCDCMTCGSHGEISHIGGTQDCPRCDGSGYRYPNNATVKVHGLKINVHYLQKITNAPALQISISPDTGMLCFKTGNQSGVIMGMRD